MTLRSFLRPLVVPLFLAAAVLAVPGLAVAKRAQLPALSASSLRAEPKDNAAVVAPVKAGDKLTILESRPDWTQVANAAGKKGWVPTKVVGEVKTTTAVATGNTQIAAAEGSTAMAVRGKPTPPPAVVGTSGAMATPAASPAISPAASPAASPMASPASSPVAVPAPTAKPGRGTTR